MTVIEYLAISSAALGFLLWLEDFFVAGFWSAIKDLFCETRDLAAQQSIAPRDQRHYRHRNELREIIAAGAGRIGTGGGHRAFRGGSAQAEILSAAESAGVIRVELRNPPKLLPTRRQR